MRVGRSLVERHNFVLSDMLDKILHDNNCDFDLAVARAVNAKNSLSNIHGFSPYQLAIGTNPKLPSLHTAKAPAITTTPANKIITRNLQALHKAREAFIASENSEKLRLFQENKQQSVAWSSQSIRTRWTTGVNQEWKLLPSRAPM